MVRKCIVNGCESLADFRLPSNAEDRLKWLDVIGQPTLTLKCHDGAVVCKTHFKEDDFISEGFRTGVLTHRRRLKSGSVPSLSLPHHRGECTPSKKRRIEDSDACGSGLSITPDRPGESVLQRQLSGVELLPAEVHVPAHSSDVIIVTNESQVEDTVDITVSTERTSSTGCKVDRCVGPNRPRTFSVMTQTTARTAPYTIEDFKFKPEQLKDLTGLPSYERFLMIFYTLGPKVNDIKYRDRAIRNVSVVDQFFLVLWKLRKSTSDIELGMHFGVHRSTVSNMFTSFVKFMAEQWGKLDIWPSRDLIDYYMPEGFKKMYPSTRVILDGTETPIQKPNNPTCQQATFSTYKNTNTLKVLIGGSPSGLISYCSEAYGGSTSDRQIVERSPLPDMCEPKDSVMADRGINVQDIFAPKNVAVNIPAFLKGKDHLPSTVIMNDRKLASKRVHIERLIGLTKTYKILRTRLNHCYVPIGSEIFFVCVMLTNFKENIVGRKA